MNGMKSGRGRRSESLEERARPLYSPHISSFPKSRSLLPKSEGERKEGTGASDDTETPAGLMHEEWSHSAQAKHCQGAQMHEFERFLSDSRAVQGLDVASIRYMTEGGGGGGGICGNAAQHAAGDDGASPRHLLVGSRHHCSYGGAGV